MKKINLKTLETVLTSKEMKNILGGGSQLAQGQYHVLVHVLIQSKHI